MTSKRFAGVIRSLNTARSRREAVTALFGGLSGLFLFGGPDVTLAKRKKGRRNRRRRKDRQSNDGPCGNGDKEGKDCRCKKQGEACANDASCCPRTKGLSCHDGTCQPCDVCLSGCDFDSVQAAIDDSAPGATIQICAGVFAERLVINTNVTLIGIGDGANGTTLDGRRGGSTVTVSNASATLERLRITGGGGVNAGGGIFIEQAGSLTLTDCTVSGNSALADGGGIAKQNGALTLNNSAVTGNEARDRGAGIFHSDGATNLNDSVVSGNEAGERGGGIFFVKGAMTLNDSSVEDNRAEIEGGGIFREGGAMSLFDSTVTGNNPDDCVGIVCANV
jgi:nitrous oxidase accessory protein NosD